MATARIDTYKGYLDRVLWMEAAQQKREAAHWRNQALSVRVALNGYWAIMAALSFASILAFSWQYDLVALIALVACLLCPLLALTDRVRFDGLQLTRSGARPFLRRLAQGGGKQILPLHEIEWIETTARRALRNGGRVYYRYRCEITGNGQTFIFTSGGATFRRMIRALFAAVEDDKLDARSLELRNHLVEPETLRGTLRRLALASEDLLKDTTIEPLARRARVALWPLTPTEEDVARGQLLRRAANELYVLGRLREAAEAFRRALIALPGDAWLIYEFARFLHSQAGVMRDEGLYRRGQAALRLAARRGHADALLLSRVGESFLEYGDAERAEKMFRRALEHNPGIFRAAAGLAEIGLRRGQLAHVLHHYNTAAAIAADDALARLARRETDYYQNLNNDEVYLEAELGRLSWLEQMVKTRRLAIRVTLVATLFALLWPLDNDTLTPAAWSLAASSLLVWLFSLAGEHWLTQRGAPDAEEKED